MPMLIYIAFLAALIVWGGALAWKWKSVRDFAPSVLEAKQRDGELPGNVNADDFCDLYVRSEGPRAQTYVFVCAALIGFLLGPLLAAFNSVWNMFWLMSGRSPVFETGTLIHTFMVYLAFTGACIGLLAVALRRYYALAPPNLRQVVRDLGGTRP